MKVLVSVLFSSAVLLSAVPSTSAQDFYYSRRYDSLDVNTIFRSSRLLNNYVDCLLDKKPCPPEGKDLKRELSLHQPTEADLLSAIVAGFNLSLCVELIASRRAIKRPQKALARLES